MGFRNRPKDSQLGRAMWGIVKYLNLTHISPIAIRQFFDSSNHVNPEMLSAYTGITGCFLLVQSVEVINELKKFVEQNSLFELWKKSVSEDFYELYKDSDTAKRLPQYAGTLYKNSYIEQQGDEYSIANTHADWDHLETFIKQNDSRVLWDIANRHYDDSITFDENSCHPSTKRCAQIRILMQLDKHFNSDPCMIASLCDRYFDPEGYRTRTRLSNYRAIEKYTIPYTRTFIRYIVQSLQKRLNTCSMVADIASSYQHQCRAPGKDPVWAARCCHLEDCIKTTDLDDLVEICYSDGLGIKCWTEYTHVCKISKQKPSTEQNIQNRPVEEKSNRNITIHDSSTGDFTVIDDPLIAPVSYRKMSTNNKAIPEQDGTIKIDKSLIHELIDKINVLTELLYKNIAQQSAIQKKESPADQAESPDNDSGTASSLNNTSSEKNAKSDNLLEQTATETEADEEDEPIIETFAGSEDLLDEEEDSVEESEVTDDEEQHPVPRTTTVLRNTLPTRQVSATRFSDFVTTPRIITSLWQEVMGTKNPMPRSIFTPMMCQYGKLIPAQIHNWWHTKETSSDWSIQGEKFDSTIRSTQPLLQLTTSDWKQFDDILNAVASYYAKTDRERRDILLLLKGEGSIQKSYARSYRSLVLSHLVEWWYGEMRLTPNGIMLQDFAHRVNQRREQILNAAQSESADTEELLSDEERERLYQEIAGIKPSIDKNSFAVATK